MEGHTKSLVKTLSGTSAQALGTGLVPSNVLIQADTGDTVYIGETGVSSTTGFLIPTAAPIHLGEIFNGGNIEYIDLSLCYVIGSDGDKVRLLWVE